MATANEELLNALVRHQIFLLRLTGSVRNQVIAILDATEEDLSDKIRSRLLRARIDPNSFNSKRFAVLRDIIRNLRMEAWTKVAAVWEKEALELAEREPVFIADITRTVSPVVLNLLIPAPALLRAIVTSRPFEGKTLREWARGIAQADLNRILDQVRIGMVQGEDSAAIARRVVGTARLRGTDGVTAISRRNAEAITRTMVNHVANAAKRTFATENQQFFQEELYVATLDARTTPICRSLDGDRFPVGQGPIPPLHFNCRSLRVPILDGQVLGERPAKSSTERQLLREYTERENLKRVTRRADLPRGHKGAFDGFSRQRVRELTGRVPASLSYEEWLKTQSVEFQNEVLGVAKGQLFRQGNLSLDRFVNRAGDELTLRELASKHKEAFRQAGLDPEDFL